jgi:hypothetical protein
MSVKTIALILALFIWQAPVAFGAASDEAWVEGAITQIAHDIVYVRAADGQLWKLKRAWVERSKRNFRPGDWLKIPVDFREAMRFNSGR